MTGRQIVNLRSSIPAYVQVADILRARIAAGEWVAGDRLPAHSDLGHQYGVAKQTVAKAIAKLRAEGLIDQGRGSGSYVRDPWPRKVVRIPPGAVLVSRMPTPAEREALDIEEGVPVVVVTHAGTSVPHPADRFEFHSR